MSTETTFYTIHIAQIAPDTYLAVSPDLPVFATGTCAEEASAKLANLATPKLPLLTLFLPSPDLLPLVTYNATTLNPH